MKSEPNNKKILSIVIPCFNEEQVITEMLNRLNNLCDNILDLDIEIIFVDDGSKDNTLELLKSFAEKDNKIKIISFARNFGHQIAVTAGIDASLGDAVVLIDADLQDPPELIHEMIGKWKEGYDVVYATRSERAGESKFKIASAHVFYRLLNRISDIPIPLDTGDFRLMSRKIVNTLRAMPERDRFIRGMVSWSGFKQTSLPYKRDVRFAGQTKYPIKKMISFAFDGIISFSIKPLRIATSFGIISAFAALVGILLTLYQKIFTDTWVEGWTSIIITILFLGGIQLICMGLIGEYIGRIYKEIKKRPHYIVDEYIGYTEENPKFSRSPIVRKIKK